MQSRLTPALETRWTLGVGTVTIALAAVLAARLTAWPPNEDEALVWFVAQQPLGDLLHTAMGERGGAPLHFLLAHVVLGISPTLGALRLLSAIPVVLALPVVAALAGRLAGRRTALVATILVAASWTTFFHAIYARMYGLFLLTTALSFLLLLRALERPTWSRLALWAIAALTAIATQPYGALVLAVQAVFVAARGARAPRTLARPAVAFAAVVLAATPLWVTYARLADRFDVGAGGGGAGELGSPGDVFAYLWSTLGDFTVGWTPAEIVVALATLAGAVVLFRARREAGLLVAAVVLVPMVALLAARSGSGLFLETRHLIFALPFVATALAVAIIRGAELSRVWAPIAAGVALAALVAGEVAWGFDRTPWLYEGEPAARTEARAAAAEWLARRTRSDDVLLGYEPIYLDAARAGASDWQTFVPRADARLAVRTLRDAPSLGHGVWVLDASDAYDPDVVRLTLPDRSPGPRFESEVFGPFLVIRSREPMRTPERFLQDTVLVSRLGRELAIGDSWLNLETAKAGLRQVRRSPRSRSTSSS